MWTQLLVIVGYYGPAAPTLFAVQGGTFFSGDVSTLFGGEAGKPGAFKWFA